MRRHFLAAAIVAGACAWPAAGQDGRWGDGDAALFNTPMGYGSQAEFNGQAKPAKDKLKRRAKRDGRFTETCITGGVDGRRPPETQTHGVPFYPCPDNSVTGGPRGRSLGPIATVVTAGARNAAIVEIRPQAEDAAPLTLNGGLDLE